MLWNVLLCSIIIDRDFIEYLSINQLINQSKETQNGLVLVSRSGTGTGAGS